MCFLTDTEFTTVGTFIGTSTIVNMAYLQAQSGSNEIRITSGRNVTNSGLSNNLFSYYKMLGTYVHKLTQGHLDTSHLQVGAAD